MNPGGPVEEAAHVATGIVDALKAQPAVLALTVANIGMMVFIFYALTSAANFRNTMLEQQHTYQREVAQLLAKCIVPDHRTELNIPLPKPRPEELRIDPPKPPPVPIE